jgi:hypothetical protein
MHIKCIYRSAIKFKHIQANKLTLIIFFQIFFVLRKKNDHVSTLHVIHHGCMPMSVWFGVKFTPGKKCILFS